ncbi:CHAT domain-containing tetratricopeptide repeat protein [Marinoscillum sp. MHG1-6]|uniref:CHAT domain-containing protein n=1 Tax=Marinoscillum sp. MHG1-6 TaxID=2959627 RepID=UPI0021572748|nr:CHAT domain-containing tetratricopeptide repeat protein [Marinoscillum sp. MHG1-6]
MIFPGLIQAQFGDLGKSLKKKAKEAIKEKIEEKNEEYETSTFNYAIAFLDKSESFENKQKGETFYKTAAWVTQDDSKKTPRDEAVSQYEFGRFSYLRRAYRLSESALIDAQLQFEVLGEKVDPVYLKTLGLLGLLYSDMGRFEKATTYTQQALDSWKEHYGVESKGYAAEFNNMAVLRFNKGEYTQAEKDMEQSIKQIQLAEGGGSMPNAISLNNKGILYLYMGRSKEATELMQYAQNIAERKISDNSGTYLQLMTNRALVLQESGDYAGAEAVYQEAIELQKSRLKVNRTGDPDYAHMLNNLASLYFQTDRLEEAESLLKESLSIYKLKFGESHPLTASAMQDLGNLYRVTGRLDKAGELLSSALVTNKKRLGDKHPKTVQSMEDMALVLWKQGNAEASALMYSDVMTQTMDFINSFFPSMSEAEKTKYWEKLGPRFFNYYNFAFDQMDDNPVLLDQAINYRIATKGLLLNTTTKIKNLILSSGNQELIELYQIWVDQKKELATYYTMSKEELEEQNIFLDQLEAEANDTEKALSEVSTIFSENMVDQSKEYQSIVSKLGPGQVAIEMIHYPYFDSRLTEEMRYAAIILKPSIKPQVVILENGSQLDSKYYSYYKNIIRLKMDDTQSYSQYWKKIDSAIPGIKTVYLSPDGVYNQLNVNTLKTPEGKFIVQQKDLHLVGNVADLASSGREKKKSRDAFLLGFPTYGSTSIAPLPGTAKEIGVVESALKSSQYRISLKLSENATESAIKQVNSPKLLHIATHGFFMEDVKSGGQVFGVQVEYAKNNPLLRSGLLLAGASEDGQGSGASFSESDNGILTAFEAINLNLSKTDLVVLSACETGKGDIKSGEGVYGLQRAFKVAGADRMIMSLWKVDDIATQKLMSAFYQNWTRGGLSPEAAFQKAQIDLMKTYPHPYYWGAFVMVE